jgi:hypothetical protein
VSVQGSCALSSLCDKFFQRLLQVPELDFGEVEVGTAVVLELLVENISIQPQVSCQPLLRGSGATKQEYEV